MAKEPSSLFSALASVSRNKEIANENKKQNKLVISSVEQITKKLSLNEEQQKVIECKEDKAKVLAYAGCGKTTTLVELANHLPKKTKGAYLAFNRSLRVEAEQKFPKNFTCLTSHQLAFQKYGIPLRHKLEKQIQLKDLLSLPFDFFKESDNIHQLHAYAKTVFLTVVNFTFSKEEEILAEHINWEELKKIYLANSLFEQELLLKKHFDENKIVLDATYLWNCMKDPYHEIGTTHDIYLKQMQLDKVKLPFDLILLDEAQDTNPTVLDIFTQQDCRQIMVGDPYQSIYQFRKSVNALGNFDGATFHLTNSYRFDKNIATMANAILVMLGETKPLVGLNKKSASVFDYGKNIQEMDREERLRFVNLIGEKAVVTRNNATMLKVAMEFSDLAHFVTFNFDGSEAVIQFNLVRQLYDLVFVKGKREPDKVTEPFLRSYLETCPDAIHLKSNEFLKELRDYCQILGMSEWAVRCTILLRFAKRTLNVLSFVEGRIVKQSGVNTIKFSNTFKAKGLEYEHVLIGDDFDLRYLVSEEVSDYFRLEPNSTKDIEDRMEMLNLIYVAITRAKETLFIPSNLQYHINCLLDYCQKPKFITPIHYENLTEYENVLRNNKNHLGNTPYMIKIKKQNEIPPVLFSEFVRKTTKEFSKNLNKIF